MLWVANLWEERVHVKQLTYSFDDEHAQPKKVVFWMSRANASKSGMGMWPRAYCVRSLSEASLADIVSAAVEEGRGGVVLCYAVC